MSLTLRLALTYLLITLVGLLLVGGGFVALAGRYLATERERELSAQAELYAALLGELAASPAQLQALAQSPPAELLPAGTAARLFSPAGALIAGDPALGPFPSRAALALVRPALPLPASQAEGRQYAARAIAGPAGTIGVVELSRSTADDARLLRALGGLALQAALGAALLMGLISALLARGLARPIVALTRQAGQMAATYGAVEPADQPRPDERQGPLWRRLRRWWRAPAEIVALERSLERLEVGLRAYLARIGALERARAGFYRGVSHELRTPLTAIKGALENMADRAPPAERAALLILEGEAARLGRLVDDLLRPPDETLQVSLVRAPVELAALADEVVALLAGRARRAGVELRAAGAAVRVLGDRDRLKQALINLLDNGLRVTPPGGAVLVRSEAVGALARLVVEDGGPGVPPERRALIWRRGERGGDPATDGAAGLGLALVSAIAAAHGGRASLDETWGPGARFVLELPRAEQ